MGSSPSFSPVLLLTLVAVTTLFVVDVIVADREHEAHGGAASAKFRYEHEAAGHNPHSDHQAVLGSKKVADEFDELSPGESKKRLAVIAKRMDANSDGFVDVDELTDWIYNSMLSLDNEETAERYNEMDTDHDGFVTWDEYVSEAFGDEGQSSYEEMDAEERRLMEEDRIYFKEADLDQDGKLSAKEFEAFQNPEHFSHMHDTLVKMTLAEKDANNDGRIDLTEFLGEIAENARSEWYTAEEKRFLEEYDRDKSGFLEGDELKLWLIPDLRGTASQEANHLISNADKDGDGRLSVDEIVAEHSLFVGSEATNYGEKLNDIGHEEL